MRLNGGNEQSFMMLKIRTRMRMRMNMSLGRRRMCGQG